MTRLLEQTVRHALKRRRPTGPIYVAIQTRVVPATTALSIDGVEYRLREARSLLEMRQILTESQELPSVILTPLENSSLPQDILVRLVGGSAHGLNPWDRLAEVLGLRSEKDIDSLLRRTVPELAKELLSELPAQGVAKLPDGRLTSVRAWRLAQEYVFGLTGELTAFGILALAQARSLGRWNNASPKLREAFLKTLDSHPEGGVIAWMLGQCLKGDGLSLPVLGLVMDVVHTPSAVPSREQLLCQGRLESYLHGVPSDAVRILLCESVRSWIQSMDSRTYKDLLHQAQALLEQIQGSSLAWTSDLLPEGFRQRWDAFADHIRPSSKDSEQRWIALQRLESHQESKDQGERLRKARMAVRLRQWLELAPPEATDLKPQVDDYLASTAWVDHAVRALAGGDDSTAFQEASQELLEAVFVRREAMQRRFAQALAKCQGDVCDGMVAIEDVLPKVVAPLSAKSRKILILVMDGLSWPCALELLEDIESDWRLLGNDAIASGAALLPVGSSVPTVTEFARTSLLAGRACKGGQEQERSEYARRFPNGHLFHKGDLADQRGQGVSLVVQDRIRHCTDPVAMVLNAVDDQLKGSDQLRFRWTRQSVPLLQSILGMASQAGCIVVLASDHGHVPEAGTQLVPGAGSGGERWLTPERACLEGEILVRGKRLESWAGEVIVPWSERIRYAPVHNGYHGGITAQEWLAPLCVLAPPGATHTLPDGWHVTEILHPTWWTLSEHHAPVPVAMAPEPVQESSRAGTGELRGTPLMASTGSLWIQAVLDSDVMEMQLKIAGRAAKVDMARRALEAFDAAPDQEEVRIHRATMAQRAREPLTRLQGWIALVGRLLNVDNTECFGTTPDGQQLYLRPRLLMRQFGVEDTK